MQVPKIIHQLWKEDTLPERYRAMALSWKRHHPDWEWRLWSDAAIDEFVARHHPELKPLFDGYRQPICRADTARYLILQRFGGLYVDLDMEAFRPLDPLLGESSLAIGVEPAEHLALEKTAARGFDKLLCPSLIASVPGHRFWAHVQEHLMRSGHLPDPLDATGPYLLTRAYEDFPDKASLTILPPETIYPADKESCWNGELFNIEVWEQKTRGAYALHWWAGCWFIGQAMDLPPPPRRLAVHLTQGEEREPEKGPARTRDQADPLSSAPPVPAVLPDQDRMISCLMVTRDRYAHALQALHAFRRQTYPYRELIIVDDGADARLANEVERLSDPRIRILRRPDRRETLGVLRNVAVGAASGRYVCQWDDDDLYDPLRLEMQMSALQGAQAKACLLSRWMIWWPGTDQVAVSRQRVWEGSLLCEKSALPPYPELRSGEDTPAVEELCRRVRTVYLDQPRLYVYVAHGANTFGSSHFDEHWSAASRRFEGERGREILVELGKRLDLATYPIETSKPPEAERVPPPVEPPQPQPESRATVLATAMTLFNAGRLSEAGALFGGLQRSFPHRPDGLVGLARIAARRGLWNEALVQWTRIAASFPDFWPAQIGRGKAFLELSRFDDADKAYKAACCLTPAHSAGWVGLGDVASRVREPQLSLQRWSLVRRRFPENSHAGVAVVSALIELGRLDEAQTIADRPVPRGREPERVMMTALILQRRQQPAAMIAFLDAHPRIVAGNMDLTNMLVQALLSVGRFDRVRAAYAAANKGTVPVQAEAYLLASHPGDAVVARKQLAELWRHHGLAILTHQVLPATLYALTEQGSPGDAFDLLDRLDHSPLTNASALKLRLAGLFERLRLETLQATADRPLPDIQSPRADAALCAIADAIPPEAPLGHARSAIEDMVERFQRLRRRYPRFHVDSAWEPADGEAVLAQILNAHRERQPLSVIRLGDGEGNFLPYPDHAAHLARSDQDATQRIWWGMPRLSEDDIAQMSESLRCAVGNADVVGIPDLSRLCFGLPVPTPPEIYHSWHDFRGILSILDLLERTESPFRPDQLLTSCHIHADLASWSLYDRLFQTVRTVSLVTCHETLSQRLAERFGVATGQTYLIPPEQKYADLFGYGGERRHYPEAFEELRLSLTVKEPGEIFLVAAGFLGKLYCNWIKERGGIAIDIGSIADFWCGYTTRSLIFTQRFLPLPGLPSLEHGTSGIGAVGASGPQGVNLFGAFTAMVGLGTAARATAAALDAAKRPYHRITIDAADAPIAAHVDCPHAITLIHTNPDLLLHWLGRRQRAGLTNTLFAQRYTIGYWAWESQKALPASWTSALPLFQELWVPSRFTADCLSTLTSAKVMTIPHAVQPPRPEGDRGSLGLPRDSILFLCQFDDLSGFERKNPLGAIAAFRRAFQADGRPVQLVVKARSLSPESRRRLDRAIAGDPSIILRVGEDAPGVATGLIAACDAVVSLHRSEGFGLTVAEAMYFGKPVLSTNWSGTMDFTTPDNSLLVCHKPMVLAEKDGVYPAGTVWADPDLDHAVSLMRQLVDNPALGQQIGQRAAMDVRRTLSPAVVGTLMSKRLSEIEAQRAAGHAQSPAPQSPAPRTSRQATEPAGKAAAEPPIPTVLILIPVKNARKHLPALLNALSCLEHPATHLSLGFLEGDSTDGSYEFLESCLPDLRRRYRRVTLIRQDHGLSIDGPRWAPSIQRRRRSIIARVRNRLVQEALTDEEWVLWIDADVVAFPAEILKTLLMTEGDIIVPHCVLKAHGQSFDLNTFQFKPEAEAAEREYVHDGIVQPPRGVTRVYLDGLRGQGPVEVNSVGGTMLLVKAQLHREGFLFPVIPHRGYLETEGFAMIAREAGYRAVALPDVEIMHAPE